MGTSFEVDSSLASAGVVGRAILRTARTELVALAQHLKGLKLRAANTFESRWSLFRFQPDQRTTWRGCMFGQHRSGANDDLIMDQRSKSLLIERVWQDAAALPVRPLGAPQRDHLADQIPAHAKRLGAKVDWVAAERQRAVQQGGGQRAALARHSADQQPHRRACSRKGGGASDARSHGGGATAASHDAAYDRSHFRVSVGRGTPR